MKYLAQYQAVANLKNLSFADIMSYEIGTKAQRKARFGFGYLLDDSNPKVAKSRRRGVLNLVMMLAPALSSGYQVCQMATCGCTNACLNTSGHGKFNTTQLARIARTRLLFENPIAFAKILLQDVILWQNKAKNRGMALAVRLNGTSDILWEKRFPQVFEWFQDIQWYDYSKFTSQQRQPRNLPRNYHLTFSRSEKTRLHDIEREILAGRNVAVVFATRELLDSAMVQGWQGFRVIDGTLDDLRYLDGQHVIVGLYFKITKNIANGKAENSGFVVQDLAAAA